MAKINIKGKTVILSLALSPEEFGGKYKLEPPSASDIESGLHLSIKVKGSRTSAYALTLIDTLMSINNIAAGTPMSVDYKMPYEDKDTLVGRGLLKLILPQLDGEDISYTDIRAADIGEHIAATSVCSSADVEEHIAAASVSSD